MTVGVAQANHTVTEIHADQRGTYFNSNAALPAGSAISDSALLIGFESNGGTYSTGVNDTLLASNVTTFSPLSFNAFPVPADVYFSNNQLVGVSTNWNGSPQNNTSGDYINSLPAPINPAFFMRDGNNGLELSTNVFNIPKNKPSGITNEITYDIGIVTTASLDGNVPDIIVTQTGSPGRGLDKFKLVDASGNIIGTEISVDFRATPVVSGIDYTIYRIASTGAVNGTFGIDTYRDVRMRTFDLSDFGITAIDVPNIARFVHTPSGYADIAFTAYNTNSIAINPIDLSVNSAVVLPSPSTCGASKAEFVSEIANKTSRGNDASEFKVKVDLPTGVNITGSSAIFSNVSTTFSATFDNALKEWTITGLENNETVTLTITTGVAGWSLPVDYRAKIAQTTEVDLDKTNNSSVTKLQDSDCDGVADEDDLDDDNDGITDLNECLSLTSSLLDWTNNTWVAGNLSDTLAVGGEAINITVTGKTSALTNLPIMIPPNPTATILNFPILTSFYQGDQNSVDDSLVFATRLTDLGTTNHIAITFNLGTVGVGLDNVNFSLFDVDGEIDSRFLRQEKYTITGEVGGVVVNPSIVPVGTQTVVGNVVRGFHPTPSVGIGSNLGVVDVTFASAVDKVTIVFEIESNLPSFSTNSQAGFSLYDISFNKQCDTDGDGVPNHIDLDSDNDGCSDAEEGDASLAATNTAIGLLSDGNGGKVKLNLATLDVAGNGVPNVASISGQRVGNSQIASKLDWDTSAVNGGKPEDVIVTIGNSGQSATFNAAATAITTSTFIHGQPDYSSMTSIGSLYYQWQVDKNNGNGFTDILGATAHHYTQVGVSSTMHNWKYKVLINCDENACAGLSSEAFLTIKAIPVATANSASNTGAPSPSNPTTIYAIVDDDSDFDGSIDVSSIDLDPLQSGIQHTLVNSDGIYVMDALGNVVFTPSVSLKGNPKPITYTVNDNDGNTSNEAELIITYGKAPIATANSASNTGSPSPNNPTTIHAIADDDSDVDGSIDVSSIDLDPSQSGIQHTLVNSDGTYIVDGLGNVVFTPSVSLKGNPKPITYTVNDNDGNTSNMAILTVVYSEVAERTAQRVPNSSIFGLLIMIVSMVVAVFGIWRRRSI